VLRSLRGPCGVADDDVLVVALSGGPDSVGLLALVARSRGGLAGAGAVVAAHLNHRLRGPASDRDALFAAASSRAAGAPCVLGEPEGAIDGRGNVESAAREERYAFLLEVAAAWGGPVCVAHTRDDQAETVLLRLGRGAGVPALAAMAARREDGVVRPLLGVGRTELRRYGEARSLVAVVDATNHDPRRLRSRVRHGLLPEIDAALGIDSAARLARLADDLRVEAALAEVGVAALLDARPEPRRLPISILPPGDVAGRVVHAWLARLGVSASRAQVAAVVTVARSQRPGARVDLAAGRRVERRYGDLLLVEAARPPAPTWPAVDLPVPGRVRAGERWWIESRWGIEPGPVPAQGPLWAWLDAADTRLPLRVRPLRAGDRMRLSRGHRKVSDLVVDAKIPLSDRPGLVAVVDGGDAVLWVPGVEGAVRGGRRARGDLGLVARPS